MKPSLGVVMVYIGNAEITLDAIKTLAYTSKNSFNVNLFLFKNGPSKDGFCIDEDYLMSLENDEFKIHHIKFPMNIGIVRPRNIGCEMVSSAGLQYCLILDNDVLMGDPWPGMCLNIMKTHDAVGHYHCRMHFEDKRTDPLWFCRSYPMPYVNAFYKTDAVATCFLFMKTEVLLGGAQFDPYWIHRYGFNDVEASGGALEDIDFCLQVIHFGFKIAACHIPFIHIGGKDNDMVFERDRDLKNERNKNIVAKLFCERWSRKRDKTDRLLK